MDSRTPLTSDETRELLEPIRSAPAPSGMARRAIDRWAEENDAEPTQARDPGRDRGRWWTGWRMAVGAAAVIAMVALTRDRIGTPELHRSEPAAERTSSEAMRSKGGADRMAEVRTSDPAPAAPLADTPAAAPNAQKAQHSTPAQTRPSPSLRRFEPADAPMQRKAAAPGGAAGSAASARDRTVRIDSPARTAAAPAEPARSVRADFDAAAAMKTAPQLGASLSPGMAAAPAPASAEEVLGYINVAAGPDGEGRSQDAARPDPRLLKLVTLDEEDVSGADLVGRLRSLTDVELRLADGLARRAVTVLCREAPLRDVLRQMSRAFGLRWEQQASGETIIYRATETIANNRTSGFAAGASALRRAGSQQAERQAAPQAERRKRSPINVIGEPGAVRQWLDEENRDPSTQIEGWWIIGGR